MSHTPLPTHPTRKHPHTGLALMAVGFRRNGAPIWPILGAAPDAPPPADPAPTNPPTGPERPEGVSEEEWNALGDPGRSALVREREARQAAERQLAATRARPTPPKPADPPKPTEPPKPNDPPKDPAAGVDVAAIVQQAVEAAVKPFVEREQQREAQSAAEKVQTDVLNAAKARLHDATDALVQIDLTTVVNDQGQADPEKVKTALDDLVTRKPHLAKVVDDRRFAQDYAGPTPDGSTRPLNDRVKDTLSRMQERAGVKFADLP